MILSELIEQMEAQKLEHAAHITINGVHEYYIPLSTLKNKKPSSEVVIFVVTADYHAPQAQKIGNKKRLYNLA